MKADATLLPAAIAQTRDELIDEIKHGDLKREYLEYCVGVKQVSPTAYVKLLQDYNDSSWKMRLAAVLADLARSMHA